jgi:hypothetical protein
MGPVYPHVTRSLNASCGRSYSRIGRVRDHAVRHFTASEGPARPWFRDGRGRRTAQDLRERSSSDRGGRRVARALSPLLEAEVRGPGGRGRTRHEEAPEVDRLRPADGTVNLASSKRGAAPSKVVGCKKAAEAAESPRKARSWLNLGGVGSVCLPQTSSAQQMPGSLQRPHECRPIICTLRGFDEGQV